MIEIIKELKEVLKEKQVSPEIAAHFIGCSGREVRRWIEGDHTPTPIYRQAIRQGIRRMRKSL